MPNTDNELLELGGGLDSPIPVNLQVLEQIDLIIEKAVLDEDITRAISVAKNLLGFTRVSGLALSKLLYRINQNWSKFYMDENDTFYDFVNSELGLANITVARYIRVWKIFQDHIAPAELETSLMSRPMRDLVGIANAVAQEVEITDENWTTLANAPDSSTVNEELRKLKGQEPRSNAMVLKMKRGGDIVCWKDGQQYFCGYLENSSEEPVVQAAIDRILSASGILKE